MNATLERTLRDLAARADSALDRWLPPAEDEPRRLHSAMRYAALGPGKRIRPVLVYATATAVGAELAGADSAAAAVEFIHAYSLIHDDLPAMDDDDLRRGRPTCHREFDEATAILAGDALQALAFEAITTDNVAGIEPERRIAMLRTLTVASGSAGMAGGQALDLAAVGRSLSLEELETMHGLKTGALIRASVALGHLTAKGYESALAERLDEYARCIGLAFQVQDDILDVEGATEVIGKPQGSDQHSNKPTYPNLLGLDGARRTANDLCERALAALEPLGPGATTLRDLARYIVARDR